jgi:hypothetical protein
MDSTLETVRAEALFVSSLQVSQQPTAGEVRDAVGVVLTRSAGTDECAGLVAAEFGEYPDSAARRMIWALATIRGAYPERVSADRELAFAS